MGDITEKESKEMFPQGLPRDFVKQVLQWQCCLLCAVAVVLD